MHDYLDFDEKSKNKRGLVKKERGYSCLDGNKNTKFLN
jgi:hypothetical protein